MKRVLVMVLLIGACCVAQAAEKEHHIMDGVRTIDDIPYNECRMVKYPPASLVHMELGQAKLMCNTFGVVRNEDLLRK